MLKMLFYLGNIENLEDKRLICNWCFKYYVIKKLMYFKVVYVKDVFCIMNM